MLLPRSNPPLQDLLNVTDQTDLQTLIGGDPDSAAAASNSIWSRLSGWVGIAGSSNSATIDVSVVQELTQRLNQWHVSLLLQQTLRLGPYSCSIYERLLEGKQLAILAAKLPPDPKISGTAQQALFKMEPDMHTSSLEG